MINDIKIKAQGSVGTTPIQGWKEFFLELGHYAAQLLVLVSSGKQVDYMNLANTLVEKHNRYGAEPLIAWGGLGIVIRIDSKNCRLQNLLNTESADLRNVQESAWDTALDIVGYCILGYKWAEKYDD